jgi:hypothetical protein
MAETSSSSSFGFTSSSSSKDSSSSSSISNSSLSSRSFSSWSSFSTSSSSSKDSHSSSSSSMWGNNGERIVPFTWTGQKPNEVKCFAYYGDVCYAGMSGDGLVLKSSNRYNWEKFIDSEDFIANALTVRNGYLFIGTAPSGKILKVDLADNTIVTVDTLNKPVVRFFEVNSILYIAASNCIYQFDDISNSCWLIYQAYGDITDVYTAGTLATISLDKENILTFDGSKWSKVNMKSDNIASFRNISKNPFSKISYSFVRRETIIDQNLDDEDFLTIVPYNKESGIGAITYFNSNLIAGGLNYGRLFKLGENDSKIIFETDEDKVYSLYPIDSKTILAAIGNTLYLGYFGKITNYVAPVPDTTTQVVPVQTTSVTKNIKIGDTLNITWTSTRGLNDAIKIEIHKNGSFYYLINGNTSNSGSYSWTIPTEFAVSNNLTVYVEWLSAGTASDLDKDESKPFSIQASTSTATIPTVIYPDQNDRWYFVKILDFDDEHINIISQDQYYSQILLGTSNGRILSTDKVKLNAYASGDRTVYAYSKNEYGLASNVTSSDVTYALFDRLVQITDSKSIEKWKFSRKATVNPNNNVTGVFVSPIITVRNDFGMWKTLIWDEIKSAGSYIRIFVKAAKSVSELYSKDWEFGFQSKDGEIGTITRSLNNIKLEGNYLQIKVEMESNDNTSMLSRIMVEYSTKNAAYFFTTRFAMNKDEVATRGFITANITQPVNTEITFGICDTNSNNWSDYKVVDTDTYFDMDKLSDVKIGIKFVSYDDSLPQVSEFSLMMNKGT